jgi:ribosome biogenesis GTPase
MDNGGQQVETRLRAWGYDGDETEGIARVVSAHGDYFHIVCNEKEDGEALARTKASAFRDMPPPVTGDFVRIAYNPQGESRITEVLPRMSRLERLDPSSSGFKAQTLAVNFDTLFFVMAVNGNASPARLDRLLALARSSGCLERVVLLLTKCDLVGGESGADRSWLDERAGSTFPRLPVIEVSALTGQGLSEVLEYVQPRRTVAFIGSSGVGKSTLVNALAGEEWMATGEIQQWSGKGRHTTTSRELVMLPCGAMALDTPGLREIGVFGADGFELKGRVGGTHRYRK